MVTRRNFLKTALTGAFGFSVLSSCHNTKQRPNVLFIIADDMNDYGFKKSWPGIKMPYLDKFKKTAVTFEHAYCAAPACVPSRAATFSGLYPHNTGAYLNGCDPWNKSPFTEIEALPECFKRGGYTTWSMGKIFHSQPPEERRSGMWDNNPWGGGFGPFPDESHQVKGKFWGVQSFPEDDFPDVKNAHAAIEFLNQEHEKPFFMVYGLWRPHSPFTAPQRFYDMYDPNDLPIPIPGWTKDDLEDVPAPGKALASVWGDRFDICGATNPEQWRRFVHAYCACTTFADWSAGRVIEALDKSPYADNTIVIFLSDNGYHCGEKNHWEKNTLWEQAALTPAAVRIPRSTHAGSVCSNPINAVDFYPTFVDYCQLQSPLNSIDGRSLRPLLENPQSVWDRPALTSYGEEYISIRDARYRYIRYPDGSEELYDHVNDPHEFENIADNPGMESIKAKLRHWKPDFFAPSFGGRLG